MSDDSVPEDNSTKPLLKAPSLLLSATRHLKWLWIIPMLGLAAFAIWREKRTSYAYLQEGHLQYRVEKYTGRTDVLYGPHGWRTVGFDRPPETVPAQEAKRLRFIRGENDPDKLGSVCVEVENNSRYVIASLSFAPKGISDGSPLTMQHKGAFLLDPGQVGTFCGAVPSAGSRDVSDLDRQFDSPSAQGWKK